METHTRLTVDVRNERPELFRLELGILGLLIVLSVFFSHAFIHNYVKATRPVILVQVPYFIAAEKFAAGPQSPSDIAIGKQATRVFGGEQWVSEEQIFAQNSDANGWVEWRVSDVTPGKKKVSIYLTNAADYGIVQVSINDHAVGSPIDLYASSVIPHPAVDLGIVDVNETTMKLRLTVVGKNPMASTPFYQFGIQGIALAPPPSFN